VEAHPHKASAGPDRTVRCGPMLSHRDEQGVLSPKAKTVWSPSRNDKRPG